MRRPVIELAKNLSGAIRGGHPWVFDRALRKCPERVRAGDVVDISDHGTRLASGFADPVSPIAVRLLTTDPDATIDAGWVRHKAREAARLRVGDPGLAATDATRQVHGENDFMPGVVVDVYAGVGVIVFDGAGAAAFWRPYVGDIAGGILDAGVPLAGLWCPESSRGGDSGLAWGEPPPPIVWIEENGARFQVDVRSGQKTGFFLDQRDNRTLVRAYSAGAEVLNLFSYTGGFSVHAALGGARRVTSVDVAVGAIDAARENFAANGLDLAAHRFAAEDAFDFLATCQADGRTYDIVIVDPPSFAPSERARKRAIKAYRRLNTSAMSVVAADGLLVTASCSSHFSDADLLDAVACAATDTGRAARVLHVRGAASDHPLRPSFPEGRYLTVLLVGVT